MPLDLFCVDEFSKKIPPLRGERFCLTLQNANNHPLFIFTSVERSCRENETFTPNVSDYFIDIL